jgi:hypothetical protein
MGQLSSDRLTHYMQATQHPGKWHGTMFAVVLYWYDQIKLYTWLKLIGHLPTLTLCLLQKVVEDVIALEYVKKREYMENTRSNKGALTYLFDLDTQRQYVVPVPRRVLRVRTLARHIFLIPLFMLTTSTSCLVNITVDHLMSMNKINSVGERKNH